MVGEAGKRPAAPDASVDSRLYVNRLVKHGVLQGVPVVRGGSLVMALWVGVFRLAMWPSFVQC